MAINSASYPGKYSNAYGNIVYKVDSTVMNSTYKFRFVFDIYMNNEKIARLKVTPQDTYWGQVDIARVLQSYMESTPRNEGIQSSAQPLSKANWGWMDADWLIYNVLIGEEYSLTPDGDPILYNGTGGTGDPIFEPSDDRFVSNSIKEWYDKETDLSPFYLGINPPNDVNGDTHRYLTNAPRIQYVRESDWGTLSALNFFTDPEDDDSDSVFCALVEYFDANDSLITSGVTYNVMYNGGWRYNCDEDTSVQPLLPDWYKKMVCYVGAYPRNVEENVGFPPNVKYYRVSLQKSIDDPIPPTPSPSNTPLQSGYVPPTAAPPPTPTPTPSPSSLGCSTCNKYSVSNLDSSRVATMGYTDCDTGSTVPFSVQPQTSVVVCSCDPPTQTGFPPFPTVSINNLGLCR